MRLNYFGARFYDPEIGMFIGTDPAGEYWNSYSYVGGNPILYVDPTGMVHEISAVEYDYRANYGLFDAPDKSGTNFDLYIPAAEVNAWLSNSSSYTPPADLFYVHALMLRAFDWQGTPYILGGSSKAGIDCSNLVWREHLEAGYEYDLSEAAAIGSSKFMEKGNVIAYYITPYKHVGILNPYNTHNLVFSATGHGARWEKQKAFGPAVGNYSRVDR